MRKQGTIMGSGSLGTSYHSVLVGDFQERDHGKGEGPDEKFKQHGSQAWWSVALLSLVSRDLHTLRITAKTEH
jgi:hypothetical protein